MPQDHEDEGSKDRDGRLGDASQEQSLEEEDPQLASFLSKDDGLEFNESKSHNITQKIRELSESKSYKKMTKNITEKKHAVGTHKHVKTEPLKEGSDETGSDSDTVSEKSPEASNETKLADEADTSQNTSLKSQNNTTLQGNDSMETETVMAPIRRKKHGQNDSEASELGNESSVKEGSDAEKNSTVQHHSLNDTASSLALAIFA